MPRELVGPRIQLRIRERRLPKRDGHRVRRASHLRFHELMQQHPTRVRLARPVPRLEHALPLRRIQQGQLRQARLRP
ncbi:hypothetical protein KH5H1_58410 [Corallococcus caeni]|nr:hypothetical protein KH5H1_58410 [Corallococcus sp. KH5-1]